MAVAATTRRLRVRVRGTVQGVGFRPFVYRLADELGLGGWVLNDTGGVLIEVEGASTAVSRFLERLAPEAPPLAAIERIEPEELPPNSPLTSFLVAVCATKDEVSSHEGDFRILSSPSGGEPAAPVTPDSATCEECLAELRDPGDRRYRYPFVNCTNCGPRFTIVEGVPYDRPLTTMAGFEMCADCLAEYEDPFDRRFHAQPNACPACGPRAKLLDSGGEELPLPEDVSDPVVPYGPLRSDTPSTVVDAVAAAAGALGQGRIVAVKGLGGYHLACRADDEGAVERLRARKHRENKPFALMVAGMEAARSLALLGRAEEEILASRERPIVLAPRRKDAALAVSVAPGFRELGLMFPYTPLHHLLLGDCDAPLVMTSGNVSDEPIAYRDEEALERLGRIADLFLTHDRPIHIRTDDSVLRSVAIAGGQRTQQLRRSRGFVPTSLELPIETPRPLLACGAELKNTFCLAKGRRAWVGHHIGDLENFETLRSFREGIEHFQRLFAVEPLLCAHDLHPEYLSTKYALEREGLELVGVQHHHAHLAACLAEHGEQRPALGAIYDGTGFGPDGAVWGGELLLGDLEKFERAGHLRPVRLPGGVAAIREPWRMACAWLFEAVGRDSGVPAPLASAVEPRDWRNCEQLMLSQFGSPLTTSVGRLFDAVGALCGAPARVSYEGQAAVELEAMADSGEDRIYEMPLELGETGRPAVLDPRPMVRSILADLGAGVEPSLVSARFHNTIAISTAGACVEIAGAAGLGTVILSGGVFQNRRLLELMAAQLTAAGLRVLTPERVPPNDGGISFGQAAVAAARRAKR